MREHYPKANEPNETPIHPPTKTSKKYKLKILIYNLHLCQCSRIPLTGIQATILQHHQPRVSIRDLVFTNSQEESSS